MSAKKPSHNFSSLLRERELVCGGKTKILDQIVLFFNLSKLIFAEEVGDFTTMKMSKEIQEFSTKKIPYLIEESSDYCRIFTLTVHSPTKSNSCTTTLVLFV